MKKRKKVADSGTLTPQEILEEWRRIHEKFGTQIGEIGEGPETGSIALQSIYVERGTQLDAFEDALGGEERGRHPLLSDE